ncbi:MAG: hypothetical protein AAFQ39_04205 [Pseudomonadota bacterium]
MISGAVPVDFRTQQAVADLQALARAASSETVTALANASPVPGAKGVLSALISQAGCRFNGPDAMALHPALTLAATLPDDDFDGFLLATAILIADRLQRGGGRDDLFWHWDAFRARYRAAPDRRRAAIFRGFEQLDAVGLVALFDKPEPRELARIRPDAVVAQLTDCSDPDAGLVLAALQDWRAVEDAAALWDRRGGGLVAARAQAMLAGFRHLYETQAQFAPQADAARLPYDAV